jgi:hypothetical protein
MKKIFCLILLIALLCLTACNTVTTNNSIVSGAIDADLYLDDKICDENNNPFENTLWEPGVLAVETFTVKNKGNIAFKYTFRLNTDGVKQVFADSLRVVVVDNYTDNMTRDEAMALFKNLDATSTISDFSVSDSIEATKSDTFTIIVYFVPELSENVTQEDVQNAKFTTQLLITQSSEEGDSFGNEYDQEFDPNLYDNQD